MRKRGLSEKTFYLFNPMPKISDAELLVKAGLPLTEPKNVDPWQVHWKYGCGLGSEGLRLGAGETWPVRESEVRELLSRSKREMGIVVLEDESEESKRAGEIEGLRRALPYWRRLGTPWLNEYRKNRGLTREDMEDYRYDLHPYYIAQAKTELIQARIQEIQAQATGAPIIPEQPEESEEPPFEPDDSPIPAA